MSPLLREEEMDAIDYGYDSDDEPMSTEMLEDIRDRLSIKSNAKHG